MSIAAPKPKGIEEFDNELSDLHLILSSSPSQRSDKSAIFLSKIYRRSLIS